MGGVEAGMEVPEVYKSLSTTVAGCKELHEQGRLQYIMGTLPAIVFREGGGQNQLCRKGQMENQGENAEEVKPKGESRSLITGILVVNDFFENAEAVKPKGESRSLVTGILVVNDFS